MSDRDLEKLNAVMDAVWQMESDYMVWKAFEPRPLGYYLQHRHDNWTEKYDQARAEWFEKRPAHLKDIKP